MKKSNIQGNYRATWKGSKVYVGVFKVLLKKNNLLNRNQCANLCKKIEHVTKVFDQLMTCTNDGLQFGLLLSELFFTINKSYFLVENCGKENWCEKAIFLLNNKEAFRELLLNLKRCCDIASDLLSKHYSNKLEAYTFATFNVATQDELKEDVEFLQKKLIQVNGEEDFEYFGLAKHLLQRYEDLLCIDGGELDNLKLLLDMKSLEITQRLKEVVVKFTNQSGLDLCVQLKK